MRTDVRTDIFRKSFLFSSWSRIYIHVYTYFDYFSNFTPLWPKLVYLFSILEIGMKNYSSKKSSKDYSNSPQSYRIVIIRLFEDHSKITQNFLKEHSKLIEFVKRFENHTSIIQIHRNSSKDHWNIIKRSSTDQSYFIHKSLFKTQFIRGLLNEFLAWHISGVARCNLTFP